MGFLRRRVVLRARRTSTSRHFQRASFLTAYATALALSICAYITTAHAQIGIDCAPVACINSVNSTDPGYCTNSADPACSYLPQCCDPEIKNFCPGACDAGTVPAEPTTPVNNTATATPTNTPVATATNTPPPSVTFTHTATATSTNTPVATNTEPPLATSTGNPTATLTATSTPAATATNASRPAITTPTPPVDDTPVPAATYTFTATATSTDTPEPTSTDTPRPTATYTATATSTNTPLPTDTEPPPATPTANPTATLTATSTPVATATRTATPRATDTLVAPATNTPLPTATYTATATSTNTPVPTNTKPPLTTPTANPTASRTATSTPQATATDTATPMATNTPAATATNTPQPTATNTPPATATPRNSPPPTSTNTPIPTATSSATSTATAVSTSSPIPPATKTPLPTATSTAANTPPYTHSPTPTGTTTPASTVTSTPTATPTATATTTPTTTSTASASPGSGNPVASTQTPSPTPTAGAQSTSASALVTLGAECIQANGDGTFTSYLSYSNVSGVELTIQTDTSSGSINSIIAGEEALTPPSLFAAGMTLGSVVIRHTTRSFTWTVKAAGSESSTVAVDSNTPACKTIQPMASCSAKHLALVGYTNPNSFPLIVPSGPDNFLSPGAIPSAVVETFLPGRIESAFSVKLSASSRPNTWTLQNQKLDLDATIARCQAQATEATCSNVNSADTLGNLDQVALELSAIAQRTALALQKAKRQEIERKKTPKQVRAQALSRIDIERRRAITRAKELEAEAYRLTIKLPKVSKTCINAPSFCESIDRFDTFIALRRLYAYLLNMTKRQTNRFHFLEIGETKRNRAAVVKAKKLVKFGHSELDKLPRIATDCT